MLINSVFRPYVFSKYVEVNLNTQGYDIEVSNKHPIGFIAGNRCIRLIDFTQSPFFEIKSITIAEQHPTVLKINSVRDELYVIGNDTQKLYCIDISQIDQYMTNPNNISPEITSVPVGRSPSSIAVSPDGKTIFVCNLYQGMEGTTVIDAEKKSEIHRIPLDKEFDPFDMAIAHNKLYVVDKSIYSGQIVVIDLKSYEKIGTISVDESPYHVITGTDETFVFISHDSIEGKISIINTSTDTVEKTIPMGGAADSVYKRTMGMVLKNDILFAVNNGDRTIAMINTQTNQMISCPTPFNIAFAGPQELAVSSDGKKLYVVHQSGKVLTIMDMPNFCPVLKKDLSLEYPNDEGLIDPVLIVESEICENIPLTLNVLVDKPDIFKTKPYIIKKGYLAFETNPSKAGKAIITINVKDINRQCFDESSITINFTGYVLTLKTNVKLVEFEIDNNDSNSCNPCIPPCNEICTVLQGSYPFAKESRISIKAPSIMTPPEEDEMYFKNWRGDYNGIDNPVTLKLNKTETILEAVFVKDYTPTGYAIIIQGRNEPRQGQVAHRHTTDYVYQTFKNRGFKEENINYYKYDHDDITVKDPEQVPSPEKIKEAITDWAVNKMKSHVADLYIVIVGHGDEDTIFFDSEVITASNLNQWLSVFNDIPHAHIIVLIGSCNSGSFIDAPDSLSAPDRIIITSSDIHEDSNKGKLFDDVFKIEEDKEDQTSQKEDEENKIIQEGDYFIYHFFYQINNGDSIRDSFKEASLATFKYFGNQHPQLDDNHDGKGTFNLLAMLNGEGDVSRKIAIGENLSGQEYQKTRFFVLPHMILDASTSTASFSLDIENDSRFTRFWIDVTSTIIRKSSTYRKKMLRMLIGPSFLSSAKAHWANVSFPEPGMYQVLFFGKEINEGHVLLLGEQIVYKNKYDR